MTSEPVLDPAALSVISSLQQPGADDLVRKIINMFIEDSELYGNVIGQSIEDGRPDQLSTAAHSLKSSAANVGAMTVSTIAAQLETLGRNQSMEAATQLGMDLQTALIAARRALIEYLQTASD